MKARAFVLISSSAGAACGAHDIAIASCIGDLLSLLATAEAAAVFVDEEPGEGASLVDLLREIERRWPAVPCLVLARTTRGQAIGLLAADGALVVARHQGRLHAGVPRQFRRRDDYGRAAARGR